MHHHLALHLFPSRGDLWVALGIFQFIADFLVGHHQVLFVFPLLEREFQDCQHEQCGPDPEAGAQQRMEQRGGDLGDTHRRHAQD